MSIRADSLIPLIQVFILKTVNYPCSPQCNVAVSTARMTHSVSHYYHLQPPDADTIHVCLSSQRNKIRILDRPAIQSNRNVKCEILEYAFIAMRGVDCVTLTKTTEGPRYGTLSLLRIWNTHYSPDDASGSVLTVCRPLIGHSVKTLPSHWLIEWWILFTLCTKEKMMSSKNVWVDNIHECLGMKTRMAISQFYSDPVPRTRTWLFTRTR